MVGNNILIGFFVILIVIGIPSILFSLITAFFFYFIQKIKEKIPRMIVPLLMVLGILVLIVVAGAGANIVAIALISLGTITPFPLFEKRLAEISPASTVFEASVITFFYFLIAEFTNQVGLLRVVSDISSGSNPGVLFYSVLFIEAMIIASLVYTGFTLYPLFIKNCISKNKD